MCSAGGRIKLFISPQSALPVSSLQHLGRIRSDLEAPSWPNLESAGQTLFTVCV